MGHFMLLYTPLEQFQVLSFFSFNLFFAFVCLFSSYDGTFYIVPNNWQIILETLYEVIAQLLFDNISTKGEIYFPFIITIFLFIMFSNLIGLVPYSFTITS